MIRQPRYAAPNHPKTGESWGGRGNYDGTKSRLGKRRRRRRRSKRWRRQSLDGKCAKEEDLFRRSNRAGNITLDGRILPSAFLERQLYSHLVHWSELQKKPNISYKLGFLHRPDFSCEVCRRRKMEMEREDGGKGKETRHYFYLRR